MDTDMPDTVAEPEVVADAPAPEPAVVDAPVVEEAPLPEGPLPERTPEPMDRAESQKALRADRVARREGTPKIDRQGNKHSAESGEFIEPDAEGKGVPSDAAAEAAAEVVAAEAATVEAPAAEAAVEEEAPAAEAAVEVPAAEERPADQLPDAEAAKRPGIQVPIAEDHPIRGMGLDAFEAANELEAQGLQALLNGVYVRKKALQELEQENRALQEKVARSEATRSATDKWQGTPEYKAALEEYDSIKEAIGPEAASRYWQGVRVNFEAMVESEHRERMDVVDAERMERQAQEWKSEAWENTKRLPREVRELAEFPRLFAETVDTLNARLSMGHYPEIKSEEALHKLFVEQLTTQVLGIPEVKRMMAARQADSVRKTAEARSAQDVTERATADAVAEGVQQFKEEVAEGRVVEPPNPLAVMSHGDGADEIKPGGPEEGPDLDAMSTHELKKHLKKGAKEDSKRRFRT